MNILLRFGINFKWKIDERLSRFKCDAFLLVDIFEKVRNNSLKNYGLCPSHCLSAPNLIELGCNV